MSPDGQLAAEVVAVAAVAAAVLLLGGLLLRGLRVVRRVVHFLDDWAGEPSRPGTPGRPGVMERLTAVEVAVRQLRPNGGTHLADKVALIERTVAAGECRFDRIEQLLDRALSAPPPTAGGA